MTRATGFTKDAGWQLGVRRTVALPPAAVWDFLLGEGLPLWLGCAELGRRKGDAYLTDDGVRGELRSRTDGLRVRLTWQPPVWAHDSTLQVTVTPAATGTATIGIHQERLASQAERKQMLTHWTAVVERIHGVTSAGWASRGSSR